MQNKNHIIFIYNDVGSMGRNKMRVIGIGDNVCDKYEHMGMMFPGGQALNFSVYAKMLGADASYMGVFGTDEVAEHVMKILQLLSVEHTRCLRYEGENGCARVTLEEGERIFLGSNKGGVAREHPIDLTQEDLQYIKTFSLVHTSNNSYMDSQLQKIYKAGVPLSYDFSGQWVREELVKRVAPYVSFVFISIGSVGEGEAEEICRNMYLAGCKFIVATRGSRGAVIYDGKEFHFQAPVLVKAVDTLGAGDSFATAFLLHFLESRRTYPEKMGGNSAFYRERLMAAAKAGAQFAAKTCLVQGAFGHGTII